MVTIRFLLSLSFSRLYLDQIKRQYSGILKSQVDLESQIILWMASLFYINSIIFRLKKGQFWGWNQVGCVRARAYMGIRLC